jgi:hypothetical protein
MGDSKKCWHRSEYSYTWLVGWRFLVHIKTYILPHRVNGIVQLKIPEESTTHGRFQNEEMDCIKY